MDCKYYFSLSSGEDENFSYPKIDSSKCIKCNLCHMVCPYEHLPKKNSVNQYFFGGYHKDWSVRNESTSGGAFSAIIDAFCDENYIIFGAVSDGLSVFHDFIDDKKMV